jgi:hypothetical protein
VREFRNETAAARDCADHWWMSVGIFGADVRQLVPSSALSSTQGNARMQSAVLEIRWFDSGLTSTSSRSISPNFIHISLRITISGFSE